jgi:hypothetical protein
VQGAALTGADALAFSLVSTCGTTLAANASCSVEVAFVPATAGAKSAGLEIRTNAPEVAVVALSGIGTAPRVVLGASELLLEARLPGLVSPSQTLSIENAGSATLNIREIAIEGPDAAAFVKSGECGSPLAPGSSCAVEITFHPTAGGIRSAILSIRSDAQEVPTVALGGRVTSSAVAEQLKTILVSQSAIAPYREVSTTLVTDVSASAATLGVGAHSEFPADANFIALLSDGTNDEYVLVTAGMGTSTWTIIRAYNGSSAYAFSAASTTVIWVPLATRKSSVINADPLSLIAATFTSSVGGASNGTLTAPVPNGFHTLLFSNGETRNATVQRGASITWSPALAAGMITSATTDIVLSPEGANTSNPVQLLTQRFDLGAPVYVSQRQRLARRGAVLTTDLPVSGASIMAVDTTADFPRTGNFMINTSQEDLLVSVANATTLNIIARGQNGTTPTALTDSASTFFQIMQADFLGSGGTQAFYVAGSLNSGKRFLGVAPSVGALREYMPKQPLSIHFTLDGSYFEVLASGNVAMLVIVDGVILHSPDYMVEATYGGRYWHKFDFGSRKRRNIALVANAYPMAIAHAATDSLLPWNRSRDPIWSHDGDSFGQTEGYRFSSSPNGGGMGLFLEAMLTLGLSQFDYAGVVGGTGYSQEGAPELPLYPRPKYSGAHRVAAIAAGPPPTIFVGGLGHNDNTIGREQFAADALTYWRTLRMAWPDTVFVATQYYFPAAGPSAPEAFIANPLSTPNDPLILAALRAVGGPWVYINSNQGTWRNSRGASGIVGVSGQPFLTGTGYGAAPGYAGTHGTGVGNGDLMIRNDGVHPSNLGARHLGDLTATAIKAGVLAL